MIGWEEYFSVYPFTQDREDHRTALLASVITNISGKAVKKPVSIDLFLPDYLNTLKVEKSLKEQKEDWEEFKRKYRGVMNEIKRESK